MNQLHGPGLIYFLLLKPPFSVFFCYALNVELYCSDELGDRPRPLPSIPELKKATDMFVRTESPSWDFDVSTAHPLFSFL